MEPSPWKNFSAAAAFVLLLVILTADSSEGYADDCNGHLSGSYSGACVPPFSDNNCRTACINESTENFTGKCYQYQCWCYTLCDFKIVAPTGVPIWP